ncbi:MAG: multifunctional oxoglutarate decarboxylase/oxoglutarate dehydrogenase thiamine pyrophosphate-binding subunit/dihydrolipoyllysine-residue succinyltransferase subunit, partial [Gemmatimonadetes bacterium]|nr:multifunctional oxoglutarate decarboxylase/oxoglutarate dehydrogenase thiamine pyrophosphate-binding subunit/dihydrolipoyllysine-residue succinyltransferase subunit [Gemmatimonadota bacterium]
MFENIFETVNSGFAQALYEDYLRDPNSVPPEWRELFENGMKGLRPETPSAGEAAEERAATAAPPAASAASPAPPAPAAPPASAASLEPIKGPALRLLENMQASLHVPTATSFREVDVSRLWDARARLNQGLSSRGIKL